MRALPQRPLIPRCSISARRHRVMSKMTTPALSAEVAVTRAKLRALWSWLVLIRSFKTLRVSVSDYRRWWSTMLLASLRWWPVVAQALRSALITITSA